MAIPIPLIMALAQFVPAITRWLSGDQPGPIAAAIADTAQTISGSSNLQEAVQRIRAEPELQRAFQLAMQDKADDLEKAYLLDRQSARERDTRIQVATGKNRRGDILAGAAITGLLGTILLLFFVEDVSGTNRDLLLVTLGALIGIVKDVYGFEFGSSKDASRGAQTISDYISKDIKK